MKNEQYSNTAKMHIVYTRI